MKYIILFFIFLFAIALHWVFTQKEFFGNFTTSLTKDNTVVIINDGITKTYINFLKFNSYKGTDTDILNRGKILKYYINTINTQYNTLDDVLNNTDYTMLKSITYQDINNLKNYYVRTIGSSKDTTTDSATLNDLVIFKKNLSAIRSIQSKILKKINVSNTSQISMLINTMNAMCESASDNLNTLISSIKKNNTTAIPLLKSDIYWFAVMYASNNFVSDSYSFDSTLDITNLKRIPAIKKLALESEKAAQEEATNKIVQADVEVAKKVAEAELTKKAAETEAAKNVADMDVIKKTVEAEAAKKAAEEAIQTGAPDSIELAQKAKKAEVAKKTAEETVIKKTAEAEVAKKVSELKSKNDEGYKFSELINSLLSYTSYKKNTMEPPNYIDSIDSKYNTTTLLNTSNASNASSYNSNMLMGGSNDSGYTMNLKNGLNKGGSNASMLAPVNSVNALIHDEIALQLAEKKQGPKDVYNDKIIDRCINPATPPTPATPPPTPSSSSPSSCTPVKPPTPSCPPPPKANSDCLQQGSWFRNAKTTCPYAQGQVQNQEPKPIDMSEYIRKDSIPCYGCTLK
jgi:hypothetical protein